MAILLAVLVLVCSGVISYRARQGALTGDPGAAGPLSVTSGAVSAYGRDDLAQKPYRRVERLRPGGGETTTSEGRRTR
ncbi:hypothetical protein ACFT9M_27745 [Micromonospora purpureochromogenes]|uniref:hypothetical protein n=1 Tax=Micromonospora purpureochromogenes TaxID=47872 RepID=UPI003637E333